MTFYNFVHQGLSVMGLCPLDRLHLLICLKNMCVTHVSLANSITPDVTLQNAVNPFFVNGLRLLTDFFKPSLCTVHG